MVRAIPPGGNWRNIPPQIPSKRLEQIRRGLKGGSRSTYYGRLSWEKPSYTISTYFNRPGNGCFIHPSQDRLVSLREGARLQSFPDRYRFLGPKTSIYKQIGNAVPPLLVRAIGSVIPRTTVVDIFCGAGGLTEGLRMSGHTPILSVDIDRYCTQTYVTNHTNGSRKPEVLTEDLRDNSVRSLIEKRVDSLLDGRELGIVAGGPPCQGFSEAGNRRSLSDPRNLLYLHFVDMVRKLRPRYVVMEQVPGVLTLAEGRAFHDIGRKLSSLDYVIKAKVMKAEEYGVPQRRRRLIIVGTRAGEKAVDFPSPLFGAGNIGLPPPLTVHDAISDLPPLAAGGGAEACEYTPHENLPPYQYWSMGIISFDRMYSLYSSG
jgi:DNA (cytosine-5)-methyltransferase 1